MFKKFVPYFVITLCLVSCMSPLAALPTATVTPIPSSTPTLTPLPTSTTTSSPTATDTPVPTAISTFSSDSVQSRDQFEDLVRYGVIQCQGSGNGDGSDVLRFIEEATAAGVVGKAKYILGSGIPSPNDPSQCVFLMTFSEGSTTIIYRNSETGEFVKLPLVE